MPHNPRCRARRRESTRFIYRVDVVCRGDWWDWAIYEPDPRKPQYRRKLLKWRRVAWGYHGTLEDMLRDFGPVSFFRHHVEYVMHVRKIRRLRSSVGRADAS